MIANTLEPMLRLSRGRGSLTLRFPHLVRLDDEVAEALGEEFDLAAGQAGANHVILDLGPIEFLTSIILAKLLRLNRSVRTAGGRLSLVNIRPLVREVFTATGLDRILDLGTA